MGAHRARPFAEPPLDPSGDQARRELAGELADPKYVDRSIVERLLDWIGRTIDRGLGAAEGASALTTFVAALVVVLLVLGVGWLVSRAGRSRAERRAATRPALSGEEIDAAGLRARAERALADGDTVIAIVDGFRALALRQVERGVIDGAPHATAHELGRALSAAHPAHAAALDEAADLFDEVLYGDHPATVAAARGVLDLDLALAGAVVTR